MRVCEKLISMRSVVRAAVLGTVTTAAMADGGGNGNEARVLEEIVVSATKRSTSLQDVAISVSVFAESHMAANGVYDLTGLNLIAPSVSFTQSGESKLNSFSVRGVGTYALSAALEPAVGVAVDGVPLARVGGSMTDLVDIGRVEVLKGPQGTLFGKNATAGVISIVNNKARLGARTLSGMVSYGSSDELNANMIANIPLSETAAARLVGWSYQHDGFIRNLDGEERHGDKNSFGFRTTLRFEPTESLQVDLTGEYTGRRQSGTAFTLRTFSDSPPFGPLVEEWEASVGIVPSPTNTVASFGAEPNSDGDAFYGTAEIGYTLDSGFVLTSVTSYRSVENQGQMDPFGTSSPIFRIEDLTNDEEYDQFTQELRVTSPSGELLEYVAGLFYYDFSVEDLQLQTFRGLPVPGVSRFSRQNTVKNSLTNYAIFGEGTFNVSESLRLIAGARYSYDSVEGSFDRAPGVGPDIEPILPTVPIYSFEPEDTHFEFVSWRAGAQLDIGADAMAYVTASRGYKAPGYNLTQSLTPSNTIDGAKVDAEIAKSLEVGLKSQWFDQLLTLNLAAFITRFEDFQTTVGFAADGPPVFVIQNAEELETSGVELDLDAMLSDSVSLGLKAAYIDAHFGTFDDAPCYAGQPTLPPGSPLQPGFCVDGVQTLDDWPLPESPDWNFNGYLRFESEIAGGWRSFAQIDANYRSSVVYETKRNPVEKHDGYVVFNANIGFGPVEKSWELSLYARNLGDEHHVARVRANSWNLTQIPSYNADRRVGLRFDFNF